MNRILATTVATVFLSVSSMFLSVSSVVACEWQDGSCSAKVGQVLSKIFTAATESNYNKEQWMRKTLDMLMAEFPDWSVALIANGLGPVQGCIHQHAEMPVFIGTTGVEIYFGQGGTTPCSIQHYGDGGWVNWAYGGWWTRLGDRIYVE